MSAGPDGWEDIRNADGALVGHLHPDFGYLPIAVVLSAQSMETFPSPPSQDTPSSTSDWNAAI